MHRTALALLFVVSCSCPVGAEEKKMAKVEKRVFGKTADGKPVDLYVLTNANGMTAKIMTYGATLTELRRTGPRRQARPTWCWASTTWRATLPGHPVLRRDRRPGVPTASPRASSRSTARSTSWPPTTAPNHLHGGTKGFDKVVWKAEPCWPPRAALAVKFTYTSKDGEEGYPGNLTPRSTTP